MGRWQNSFLLHAAVPLVLSVCSRNCSPMEIFRSRFLPRCKWQAPPCTTTFASKLCSAGNKRQSVHSTATRVVSLCSGGSGTVLNGWKSQHQWCLFAVVAGGLARWWPGSLLCLQSPAKLKARAVVYVQRMAQLDTSAHSVGAVPPGTISGCDAAHHSTARQSTLPAPFLSDRTQRLLFLSASRVPTPLPDAVF